MNGARSESASTALTTFAAASVATAAIAQPASPTFHDLGVLPGASYSFGHAISGDGSAAAGYSDSHTGVHAICWTLTGGLQDLGTLSGGNLSLGFAMSGDGSTVVGLSTSSSGDRAFRWTANAGMQSLGSLWSLTASNGRAVNWDGSIAVGGAYTPDGERAFRWTAADGIHQLGPLPPGWVSSIAYALSSDGSVVAGWGYSPIPGQGQRAFRWTLADGMQDLGSLPGGDYSIAYAVCGDGSAIAGLANTDPGHHAFRWTVANAMQDLGALPPSTYSTAYAISGDGSTVAGANLSPDRAFLWSASIGMVDLNAYLTSLGINLTGWVLTEATGLSFDGTAVVGNARFNFEQRAWVVRGLPFVGCLRLTTQPGSLATCTAGSGLFSVVVEGSQPAAIQWQVLVDAEPGQDEWRNVVEGINVIADDSIFKATGAMSSSLVVDRPGDDQFWTPPGGVSFRCVVSNSCGSVASETATLTICVADQDCSGFVNGDDFDFFCRDFVLGHPAADIDHNGFTNGDDFDTFSAAFERGC